ncbi:hypothetical protein A3F52_03475 [Candidatus Uhrbacteria bacterium RIFCSPHIGHO2_12_FULL_47_11]|nr:MAG: hypothetical protein A2753_03250 [Candidatus Uhrbacteria bacterium RIFCSPHIGHO2_01_FULL_47_11]OGL69347.1 MAG: hypothetical protein A3D58_03600 [Candidatus Uhrbacteria bacterium RIFCSPHIGHO2_02_FULL_46_47]OGL75866.1 MAG: hypothetical protein A3F52_03475 [Candidatus Uhrbacteria bacterium RIFCSPHIGHO2_12_FULL_47_11]OGL92626.1 MAG: hypothetical protein A3H11_04140 [Candidatus Uhrbacteria bacterium RIFCSPLOWO2_12_FULL_47_10]
MKNIFKDMKVKNPKIKYDPEAKILSIRLGASTSVDSEVKGNVVLDYDAKGNLVNVDIMKVSLSEFGSTPTLRELIRIPKTA